MCDTYSKIGGLKVVERNLNLNIVEFLWGATSNSAAKKISKMFYEYYELSKERDAYNDVLKKEGFETKDDGINFEIVQRRYIQPIGEVDFTDCFERSLIVPHKITPLKDTENTILLASFCEGEYGFKTYGKMNFHSIYLDFKKGMCRDVCKKVMQKTKNSERFCKVKTKESKVDLGLLENYLQICSSSISELEMLAQAERAL